MVIAALKLEVLGGEGKLQLAAFGVKSSASVVVGEGAAWAKAAAKAMKTASLENILPMRFEEWWACQLEDC